MVLSRPRPTASLSLRGERGGLGTPSTGRREGAPSEAQTSFETQAAQGARTPPRMLAAGGGTPWASGVSGEDRRSLLRSCRPRPPSARAPAPLAEGQNEDHGPGWGKDRMGALRQYTSCHCRCSSRHGGWARPGRRPAVCPPFPAPRACRAPGARPLLPPTGSQVGAPAHPLCCVRRSGGDWAPRCWTGGKEGAHLSRRPGPPCRESSCVTSSLVTRAGTGG